jgi:hypothetical protein
MKYLLTVILALLSLIGNAQFRTITGRITDSVNKAPIINVNISVTGTNYGCASDSSGYFTLRLKSLPAEIRFSHIFYNTKTLEVSRAGQIRRISLSPQIYLLDDAIVKPVVNITKGMLFDIKDYIFAGDSILLSGYCYKYPKEENPWLIAISPNGDTLSKQIIGVEGQFYRDCMNNLHYLTENTAYQMHWEENEYKFIHAEPRKRFEEFMYPCKFETESAYLFQIFQAHNQMIDYYAVNKISKKANAVINVEDPIGLRMLADRGRFHAMGNNKPTAADIRFEEMCFFDSIYSPLIQINDSLYFFNFIQDEIIVYDETFNKIRDINCNAHHDRDFKEKLIVDEIAGRVYALYQRAGLYHIREISLISGDILESYKIPDYQWIDKIEVNNNRLYFLYRKKFTGDLISLYRMKL